MDLVNCIPGQLFIAAKTFCSRNQNKSQPDSRIPIEKGENASMWYLSGDNSVGNCAVSLLFCERLDCLPDDSPDSWLAGWKMSSLVDTSRVGDLGSRYWKNTASFFTSLTLKQIFLNFAVVLAVIYN